MRRRNRAEATVERWRPELRRFVEWAGDAPLHTIDARQLEFGFLASWELDFRTRNGRAPSPNSLRAVIQALRSFYSYFERYGYLCDPDGHPFTNPAAALEAPTIRPAAELDILSPEEDQALFGVRKSQHEAAVVFFLRMTGLRLNEALTLTNRDVDLAARTVNVRESKSAAGFRGVPIVPELSPHISAWTDYTTGRALYSANGPFLVTRIRTPMLAPYVEAAVARVAERAELDRKVTPHTLRRTFGSDLLNRGVRLEVVSIPRPDRTRPRQLDDPLESRTERLRDHLRRPPHPRQLTT